MTGTRDDFLSVARSAADLLRAPAVAAAWSEPSALAKLSVGGLAGHLAYQILAVPQALADPAPQAPIISLLEHYRRVGWIGADLDEEINVRIRHGGEQAAAEGPVALAARVDAAIEELTGSLATAADRPVRIPLWGPWSLLLDDLLVTPDDGACGPLRRPSGQRGHRDAGAAGARRRHGDRAAVPPSRTPPRPDRCPARPQPRRTRPSHRRRLLS
jgi:hypothetical protein